MHCSVAASSQNSSPLLSFSYSNIKLSDLIDTIRVQGGLKISYDVNVIPVDSLLNITVKEQTGKEILNRILKDHNVEVLINDNQAIIRSKQGSTKRRVIRGRVENYRSQPLPLVNISVRNKPVGTITNNNGEFILLLPDYTSNDTLCFSNLGYKTEFLPVSQTGNEITVKMTQTSIPLPEVMIRFKNVNDIIEQFRKNREKNYPEEKMLATAFFREAIKEDGDYVNVAEAVINIIKFPYNRPYKLEYVKFVKGRKYKDVANMKDIKFRIEGGPFYFSRIDIARYMDILPHNTSPPIYKYKLEGLDYEYNRMVYLVAFEPIDDNGELLYKGVMRIDTKSYALISADFELSKKSLKESRKYFIRKESAKIKARPVFARYTINYRPYKNIWLLNKIRGEMKIRVNDRNRKTKHTFEAVSELLMSSYKNADKLKFKPSEQFKASYILTDKIKEYDPEFWKNFNIIQPDEDIENVFKSSGGKKE
jgi:hypothetical protein